MTFEEFRDLPREEKDKLFYSLLTLMEKTLALAKAGKENSIDNFMGLKIDVPEVPQEVVEAMGKEKLYALSMVSFDPSNGYRNFMNTVDSNELAEMSSDMIRLFNEAALKRKVEKLDSSIEQSVLSIYGKPAESYKGYFLDEMGVLSYPECSDLYPMCALWFEDDVMLVYPGSIVAFVKKSATAENPKPVNIYFLD